MAEPLSLSLQAFPPVDKEKESLEYLIRRVNNQGGSFRNITEQSLEEEIRELDTGGGNEEQEDVVATVEAGEDAKTKKEEVSKAREEILKHVGQAHMESLASLEFVSLLLSKHAPAAAQTTMSAFLKQTLPLGSLGAEVVQAPKISDAEKQNENMVAIGWRMQSLNRTADSLLESSSRLEEEISRETRYWEQVLAVKEKGWSLHRLPREKHTLGVRYGFAEAYSDFRDRGLAALRRDEDGNISLDRGVRSRIDRKLRVRILQRGKPIASNIRSSDTSSSEYDSVEKEILKARNSIFDEELHHELDREARNLTNQGVRCINGSILVPYEIDKQIELHLVSTEDEIVDESTSSDLIVDTIAISLRILLSHAHRQNLQNRSKPPPPLRENKTPRPIYALLKPILEFLQHQSHINATRAFLDTLRQTLAAAALDFSIETHPSSHDLTSLASTLNNNNNPPTTSAVETLLEKLTSPIHDSITLHLPDQLTHLTLETHTTLLPPHFGTTFSVTTADSTPDSPLAKLPQTMQYTTLPTLQTHILHLATLSILQSLLLVCNPDSTINMNNKANSKGTWHLASSSEGNALARTKSGAGARDLLSVHLTEGRLDLAWRKVGDEAREGMWTWYGDDNGERGGLDGQEEGDGEGERRSFIDVFRGI